ncbi:MAG TPA: DegT/DnrJ/EryC1/StrS family aminotransferase, partial [Terriglobia bacterium]|nr:DegT/DnrJ/EryC1/StrS family aminotransferase [Terriglobia bacterium]
KYHNEILGGNFRLDEIQAAVLRVKLKYLEGWTEGRRRNAGIYRELLRTVAALELPHEISGARHIYNQFVIRTPRRDAIMSRLKEQGIGCEIYYPIPLPLLPCFQQFGSRLESFPVSELASQHSLALPIYPELTADMIRRVADTIAGVCAS